MLYDYFRSAFSKGLHVIYGIVILKSLAMFLAASDFAEYYMFFNVSLYAYALLFGIQNAIILRFYYIWGEDKLLEIIKNVNTIILYGSAVVVFIIMLFAEIDILAVFYTWLLTMTFGLFNNELGYFRIKLKFNQVIYFQVYQLLLVIVGIYLCHKFLGYREVLLIVAFSYFLPIFIYRNCNLVSFFGRANFCIIKMNWKAMKYAIPTIVVALMTFLIASMNQYILRYFGFQEELAGYIANYYIAEKSVVVFLSVVAMVYIPMFFKKYSQLCVETFKDIFKIVVYFSIVSCSMIFCLFFIHDYLTIILSNQEYLTWSWVIPYIAIGGLFLGINSIVSEVFTVAMKTHILMYSYIIGGILNFTLNFIFIPSYGIVGAVMATICSYIGMLSFTLYVAYLEYKHLEN